MKTRHFSLALSLGTAAAIFAGSALASPAHTDSSPFSAERIEVTKTGAAEGKCGANQDGKCGAAKPGGKPDAGHSIPPAAKPIVKPKPKHGKKHKSKRKHTTKSKNRR
ncbi:hypothetical protein [Thiothrix subterranea]|uniref:Low-complexity protein n=1 Tax=Thiothrix subterranea TaxID=2735563 RepID=A0AA51MIK0_9GAMM|nr:hypothetical protein [Thiothrix subterranea]MDQ5768722.1 hypothetical protein [Thiothrix subterranea]WML84873.1 hypothetical protein RCG00_00115 [Thiothrix subterranea]